MCNPNSSWIVPIIWNRFVGFRNGSSSTNNCVKKLANKRVSGIRMRYAASPIGTTIPVDGGFPAQHFMDDYVYHQQVIQTTPKIARYSIIKLCVIHPIHINNFCWLSERVERTYFWEPSVVVARQHHPQQQLNHEDDNDHCINHHTSSRKMESNKGSSVTAPARLEQQIHLPRKLNLNMDWIAGSMADAEVDQEEEEHPTIHDRYLFKVFNLFHHTEFCLLFYIVFVVRVLCVWFFILHTVII